MDRLKEIGRGKSYATRPNRREKTRSLLETKYPNKFQETQQLGNLKHVAISPQEF